MVLQQELVVEDVFWPAIVDQRVDEPVCPFGLADDAVFDEVAIEVLALASSDLGDPELIARAAVGKMFHDPLDRRFASFFYGVVGMNAPDGGRLTDIRPKRSSNASRSSTATAVRTARGDRGHRCH